VIARLLALATVSLAAAASCSAPSKGALILAISTDMQTPKDIDIVSVFVSTNDVPKLDFLGRVTPEGTVDLPSTLAIVEPDDPSAQVRVRVTAFQDQKARVLRDVVTTVPHQRTVLLRVPLSYLDDGSAIGTLPAQFVPDRPGGPTDGDTQFDPTDPTALQTTCDFTQGLTSIAGTCANVNLDPSGLVGYVPSLVYGDGGSASDPACFPVGQCFAKAAPIAPSTIAKAPDGSCSFALAAEENGQNWNCALATTDGTGACSGGICLVPLESDPGEGFTIQPGKSLQMVPGVCNKLASGATLYVDKASCSTKVEASPVCETNMVSAPTTDASTSTDATLAPEVGTADAAGPIDGASPAQDAFGGCKSDSQCSGSLRYCNVDQGVCVACIATGDCLGGEVCQGGACIAGVAGDDGG
jgi:hypothetical protein